MVNNLNNQINEGANSTIGALQWNLRSRAPFESGFLDHKWLRNPGIDESLNGAEYDFVSNDINLYFHRRELIVERRFIAGKRGAKNRRATDICSSRDRDFVDSASHGV